jgi:hypothetical protein
MVCHPICGNKTGAQQQNLRHLKQKYFHTFRNVHIEELYNLCISSLTVRAIKSRRMIWMWYIAHMEVIRNAYKIVVRKAQK